jgi:hypothetical protein
MDIVERYRSRGLPTPINGDVLARAGISESLIPRTVQALQSLDLITPEGMPSPVLEGIRLAAQGEYQQRLLDWLNATYADALQFVDPAAADENAVRDAFRNYKPIGQQPRMVSLFMGLFKAAGVAPAKPTGAAPLTARKKPVAATPSKRGNSPPTAQQMRAYGTPPAPGGLIHPAIAGLLSSLPTPEQGWSQDARNRWYGAFGAVLDLVLPPGARAADTAEADDASA